MLTPLPAKQWDLQKAAHLLNRAGFGGTPDEIKAFCELGLDHAVQTVLDGPDDSLQFPKPDWAKPRNDMEMRQTMMLMAPQDRKALQQQIRKQFAEEDIQLVNWWLNRMRYSANPYREKMTLFWHGHFATSVSKVRDAYLMWLQNETLRQHAYGNFGLMVKAISRDPAMLIWLDIREDRKDHPNENFAREVMELFTLGIGNYVEKDIQESARAYTGYRIDPRDEAFRYVPFQHDDGEKHFLGKTGAFDGDDIIDIILAQPACAKFIGKKLWTFYAYEDPAPGMVDALAYELRNANYELRPLMGSVFRSAEFYSANSMRNQIKSPIQWMIETSKVLEVGLPGPRVAINALRQLGQVPFAPPNVKGWDGGRAWITTSTLLYRYNMANFAVANGALHVDPVGRLAGNKTSARPGFDVSNFNGPDFTKIIPQEVRDDPKRLVDYLCFRLYQDPLSPGDTATFVKYVSERGPAPNNQTLRELLHLMMSTPQYQLT
ncbi:MAG TPA: DUF1800 domain-containing protein [Chthoniobacteraceae bacterium]|jgi:uncharacterized protein (DUF1800 family)|nr:DUF1800 domain-containing protein [Chthoniobacteraceae bacterium]